MCAEKSRYSQKERIIIKRIIIITDGKRHGWDRVDALLNRQSVRERERDGDGDRDRETDRERPKSIGRLSAMGCVYPGLSCHVYTEAYRQCRHCTARDGRLTRVSHNTTPGLLWGTSLKRIVSSYCEKEIVIFFGFLPPVS